MKILVTGSAGFIGYHLCNKLLEKGYFVYGIDNLNSYYDVRLKLDRLNQLGVNVNDQDFLRQKEVISRTYPSFHFKQMDIADEHSIDNLFANHNFNVVVNLAAQAGVRYSIENPKIYVQSNIVGFINILEACRNYKVNHLVYASSSSVYGNNDKVPFSETDNVDHPISLYAATKKSNELMAFTYSHLYGLPTTGLRFFTVYGPWGRPDMAPFLFTKAILEGKPIRVFNNGNLERDFTYVDDVIDGMVNTIFAKAINEDKQIPYNIFNIGNHKPVSLLNFIRTLENYCGKESIMELLPMQQGDVYKTYADISALQNLISYNPKFSIQDGLREFVDWYISYYGK